MDLLELKRLYEHYLDLCDDDIEPEPTGLCNCDVEPIIVNSFPTCPDCGIVDIDHPGIVVDFDNNYNFSKAKSIYKRRLYCREKLRLLSAYKFPRNCKKFNNVVKKLKKIGVENLQDVKKFLKNSGNKQFYKFVYSIYYLVTGERLISLTGNQVEIISNEFSRIEGYFRDSTERHNIYNYNSMIYLLMKKHKIPGYNKIKLPLNHKYISKKLRTVIK